MKALRVLVIEDDALIAMLLEEVLAGMGHEVCATAITQVDAVTAAVRHRPDLVIADVRLRKGSGLSAVEEILRTGPVPYVFASGDPAEVNASLPGAVVVRKPYSLASLATAIERALGAAAAS